MKKKARHATEALELTDIPNVGISIANDLRGLGITQPKQLVGQDAFALYQKINLNTGVRHDPCVLDTFIAAVDFMQGGDAKPWWLFTAQRKKRFPNI